MKYSDIKTLRQQLLEDQSHICKICQQLIIPGQEVLDHNHKTGHIRAVLHRSCNSLLGQIETNRFGVLSMQDFLGNVWQYLQADTRPELHPTFKTPEQKKALRLKRARKLKTKQ